MFQPHRKHSAEFKREAVMLSLQPDRTVRDVADKLGINRCMLSLWRAEFEARGEEAFSRKKRKDSKERKDRPQTSDEIVELRKQLARAEQERDILKKALAYFAKERS
jgi:transposase